MGSLRGFLSSLKRRGTHSLGISFVLFAAFCLMLPLSARAADKLVVKDASGTNTVFDVTSTGQVAIGTSPDFSTQDVDIVAPNNGFIRLSSSVANNTVKAARFVLRHYSNSQAPVYLFGSASTPSNNFVAFGGGYSGANAATQIDLYTAANTTTPQGTSRITITGNGYIGVGTQSPSHLIQLSGGAYSNGSSWVNASSRALKEDIRNLSATSAMDAFMKLDPVTFRYKEEKEQPRVGFIAEDVPSLVAMKGRKGLSAMDIVAVVTKVVQEQQKTIHEQQKTINELSQKLNKLQNEVNSKGVVALRTN